MNIPRIYGTEKVPLREKVIYLHYFTGACDWWLVELDPVEGEGFGYACLGDPDLAEWGYVPLPELEAVYRPPSRVHGVPGLVVPPILVERDLHWVPRRVKDVRLPGFPR